MIETFAVTAVVSIYLGWATTYLYMSTKLNKLRSYLEFLEAEYGDLMDDWNEHRIDDMLLDYAEYRVGSDGNWNRVF